jgi:hypothetical protein
LLVALASIVSTITATATAALAIVSVVTIRTEQAALDIVMLSYVRQKGKFTGTLDCCRYLTLMAAACAGNPAATQLATVGNEATERCDVTPIDVFDFVLAIRAGLPAAVADSLFAPPWRLGACALSRHLSLDRFLLEGNVFVPGTAGSGRGCKVAIIDWYVSTRCRGATSRFITTAQKLYRLGDDFDLLALLALCFPLTPLETTVNSDGAALGQEAGCVLALSSPNCDIKIVRLVFPLTTCVLAARVDSDAQFANCIAAGKRAQLGVPREVSGDDYSIDIDGHGVIPFDSD